jgi:uncharacterized surface protein with fasciclin (FAS1) repeats
VEIQNLKIKKYNMKNKIINIILSAATVMLLMTSCNKELYQFPEGAVVPATGPTLNEVMQSNTDDSLYYKMITRIGLNAVLADTTKFHTLFVTNNNGLKPILSGIAAQAGINLPVNAPDAFFSAFISQMPISVIGGLVAFNTVPQKLMAYQIGSSFPNFIYPTILNPSPSSQTLLGPVLRLAVYPSTANGAWLNNVPIVGLDQQASNGIIHHIATLAIPGQRYLWDRISADAELTYLKAAVERADSGVAVGSRLQDYLSSFGPDFTVFAPVDTAFKSTLKALILQGLLGQGLPIQIALPIATQLSSTPNVFNNPSLANALSPTNVKGIVVYHVLGKRAFTNNFPTAETAVQTLLNSGIPSHPGLKIKSTFTAPNPFVTGATVKDIYNNSPAANIILNASPLTPDPIGTSDQNFVNGVLHKIDKVLLPQ